MTMGEANIIGWQQDAAIRYVTPPTTTTQAPRLQQRWFREVYYMGRIVERIEEWRDVPLVVLDGEEPRR